MIVTTLKLRITNMNYQKKKEKERKKERKKKERKNKESFSAFETVCPLLKRTRERVAIRACFKIR